MDPITSGLIVASICGGISMLFKPVRESTAQKIDDLWSLVGKEKCRLFIYGPSRSGKTTLIKDIVTIGSLDKTESTESFKLYTVQQYTDLKQKTTIRFMIGDYRGQNPSQIIVNPPKKLFGSKSNPKINIIFFIVDLFPEYLNGEGKPLSVDEIVNKYRNNFVEEINNRVQENFEYINAVSQARHCSFFGFSGVLAPECKK